MLNVMLCILLKITFVLHQLDPCNMNLIYANENSFPCIHCINVQYSFLVLFMYEILKLTY